MRDGALKNASKRPKLRNNILRRNALRKIRNTSAIFYPHCISLQFFARHFIPPFSAPFLTRVRPPVRPSFLISGAKNYCVRQFFLFGGEGGGRGGRRRRGGAAYPISAHAFRSLLPIFSARPLSLTLAIFFSRTWLLMEGEI